MKQKEYDRDHVKKVNKCQSVRGLLNAQVRLYFGSSCSIVQKRNVYVYIDKGVRTPNVGVEEEAAGIIRNATTRTDLNVVEPREEKVHRYKANREEHVSRMDENCIP